MIENAHKVLPFHLAAAARSGDLEKVEALLAQGANPNDVSESGDAALLLALWTSHAEVALALIDAGADVNMRAREVDVMPQKIRERALASAVTCSLEVVQKMVEKGAKVNEEVPGVLSPLLRAVDNKKEDVVRFLVEEGANVEGIEAWSRRTLVMKAAERNLPQIVQLFIEKGADIASQDKDGLTALDIARERSPASAEIIEKALAAQAAAAAEAARQAEAKVESARHAAVATKQERLKKSVPKFRI